MNPQHINISNLNYSITSTQAFPPWSNNSQYKHIVHDVWANIRVNKLTALMGSSGSAKTTLLNILSQRLVNTTASSFSVKSKHSVSGCVRFPAISKGGSHPGDHASAEDTQDAHPHTDGTITFGYVKQHDFLLPYYTVREYLTMCANLTLPHLTNDEKAAKVSDIINLLGLTDCQDTRIGNRQQFIAGISGGEARRVSIAMQLLKDPDILFVDEVTTGLDSTTSYHIIQLLKMLCRTNNITIIISLHQPRRDIFALFDDIILLAKGRVIYNGLVDNITAYFRSTGFICPDFTNNSDFIIDICAHDGRDEVRDVVSQERIAYLIECWQRVQRVDNYDDTSQLIQPLLLQHAQQSHNDGDHAVVALPSNSGNGNDDGGENDDDNNHHHDNAAPASSPAAQTVSHPSITIDPTSVDDLFINDPTPPIKHTPQTSFFRQYITLTQRFLTSIVRDPLCVMGLIAQSLILALCYGIIYVDLGLSAEEIRMRASLMYLSLTIVPYVSLVVHIYLQCRELIVFDHEYSERLYHPVIYCLARLSAFIPTCSIISILATMVLLFMSNLRGTPAYNNMIDSSPELLTPYVDIWGNASHVIIHIIVASVIPYIFILALSMMCTAFQRGFASASLIANSVFTFTSFTSGYFIKHDTIPVWLQWIKHISYIYHCFTMLMYTQFHGQSFYCPFVDPNDIPGTMDDPRCAQYDGAFVLKTFEIDTSGYTIHVIIPIALILGCLFISMGVLTFVKSSGTSVMPISNQVNPDDQSAAKNKKKKKKRDGESEEDELREVEREKAIARRLQIKHSLLQSYHGILSIAKQLRPSDFFSSFPLPQSSKGSSSAPAGKGTHHQPLPSPPLLPDEIEMGVGNDMEDGHHDDTAGDDSTSTNRDNGEGINIDGAAANTVVNDHDDADADDNGGHQGSEMDPNINDIASEPCFDVEDENLSDVGRVTTHRVDSTSVNGAPHPHFTHDDDGPEKAIETHPPVIDFAKICPALSDLPYDLLAEMCLPEFNRQKEKLLDLQFPRNTASCVSPTARSSIKTTTSHLPSAMTTTAPQQRASIKFNQFSLLVPMRSSRRQKLKAMILPSSRKNKTRIKKTTLVDDYAAIQSSALAEFNDHQYIQKSWHTADHSPGHRNTVDVDPRLAPAPRTTATTPTAAATTMATAASSASAPFPQEPAAHPELSPVGGEDGDPSSIEDGSDDDVNMIRFLTRAQTSPTAASTPKNPPAVVEEAVTPVTTPTPVDAHSEGKPSKKSMRQTLTLPLTSITLNAVHYLPWCKAILSSGLASHKFSSLLPPILPPSHGERSQSIQYQPRHSIPSSPSHISVAATANEIVAMDTNSTTPAPVTFEPPVDYRILFNDLTKVPAQHVTQPSPSPSPSAPHADSRHPPIDCTATSETPPYVSLIKNLTVEMNAGSSWAILGASGSGKTSLLRYLIQQLDSDSYAIKGQSSINDYAVNKTTSQKFIGYLSQQDVLLPHLTVYETLTYIARLKLCHKPIEEQDGIVRDVIRELNLVECQHNLVGGSADGDQSSSKGISGGEKRRTCIAIVLLSSPSILLLDEPTSGLDSFQSHVVCELLRKLSRKNRLVVATLHQPRFDVFALFDNVILMAKSNIVYSGSVSNLVKYFESIPFIPRIQDYGIAASLSSTNGGDVGIASQHQPQSQDTFDGTSSHSQMEGKHPDVTQSANATNVNPADWVVDIMAIDYAHGSLIKHATASRVLALAKILYYRRVYIQQRMALFFKQFYSNPHLFDPDINPCLHPAEQLRMITGGEGVPENAGMPTDTPIVDDGLAECVVCLHCSAFYSLTSLSMPCIARLGGFKPLSPQQLCDDDTHTTGQPTSTSSPPAAVTTGHPSEIELSSLENAGARSADTDSATTAAMVPAHGDTASPVAVVHDSSTKLFTEVASHFQPVSQAWLDHVDDPTTLTTPHTSTTSEHHQQHSFIRIMVSKKLHAQFEEAAMVCSLAYDQKIARIELDTQPAVDQLTAYTGAEGDDDIINANAVTVAQPSSPDPHSTHAVGMHPDATGLAVPDADYGSIAFNKPAPLRTAYPILLKRSFINLWRQPDLFYTRPSQTIAFGVLLTIFVGHMSYSQESLTSRIGVSTLLLSLASVGLLNALAVFPMERNMYYYEAHTDHNLYSSISFLLSYCTIEIAGQLVSSLLAAILIVFGCNLSAQDSFGEFILVTFTIFNLLMCGESLGMLFACCFYHIGFTVSVVTTIIATFDTMAGVLSIESQLIYPLRILNKVSVHWYAVRAFALVDLFDRPLTCDPADPLCLYTNGTDYLDLFGFDDYHSSFWLIIIMMPILNFVYRFFVYLVLSLHIPTMKTSSSNTIEEENDDVAPSKIDVEDDGVYDAHIATTV